jgi:RNA polymerase sigma-70 factor (ECF subfamily)
MERWDELTAALAGPDADHARLAALLQGILDAGRARWPAVPPLAPADLVAHVAAQLAPDADAAQHLAALVAPDLYLALGCALEVPEALAAFDDEYLARVPAYVAQIDASAAFGDEIRQVLRARLLVRRDGARARIAEYTGRGALAAWLRVVAVRAALDIRTSAEEAHRVDAPSLVEALADDSSPEIELLRRAHLPALEDALRRALAGLSAESRVILRMYFATGQNTSRIAAALRVDRSTAARKLVAARQAVFDETKRLLRERLPIASAEFASLALALHEQMNVSLGTLLRER